MKNIQYRQNIQKYIRKREVYIKNTDIILYIKHIKTYEKDINADILILTK